MSAKIMDSARFEEMKRWAVCNVSEMRAEGKDNNTLRCWMIGAITVNDMEGTERAFTASQLAELFDLTF